MGGSVQKVLPSSPSRFEKEAVVSGGLCDTHDGAMPCGSRLRARITG